MHNEGDHMTLINIYNAFLERTYTLKFPLSLFFHPTAGGSHMYCVCVCVVTPDNQDAAWCAANFLSHAALRLAVVIRAELLEVMQRIELPISPPAFGCQDNCTNIKRALISGFFLRVSILFSPRSLCAFQVDSVDASSQKLLLLVLQIQWLSFHHC